MPWSGVPAKTPEGQAELAQRSRGLSQRHRTALFLVDGRRPGSEVLALGEAAGVPRTVFDELVSLGLVHALPVAPVPHPATATTVPSPLADEPPSSGLGDQHAHIELPLGESTDSSLLPAAASLLPESAWTPLEGDSQIGDLPLHEAREVLAKLLRTEAPVTGTLMLRRVRRAATRDELVGLLDEVERRLRRPRRMIIVAQTLRHVRHLLSLPPPSVHGRL